MTIWVVQFRRSRRALAEARLFVSWKQAMRYIDQLYKPERRVPLYMKPMLFQVTKKAN